MKLITPIYLKKGDKIALVAPASFIKDEKPLVAAEEVIRSWGLVPVRGKYVLETYGTFAGTDKQRLQDIQEAFDNPEIKAVWAVRGGYGVTRLLPKLNYRKFKKNPKWIIGFSDITALHCALLKEGFKSIHATMPIEFQKKEPATRKAIENIHEILLGDNLENLIEISDYNSLGSMSGEIVGGNLAVIESLLGTPYQLNTRGKILFLEEVGEPLYKIDRMIQSLKLAGLFKDLKGLVIGSFSAIKETETEFGKSHYEIIKEAVSLYDYTVFFDIPVGHISDNRALIIGSEITINIGEFISCMRFVQETP